MREDTEGVDVGGSWCDTDGCRRAVTRLAAVVRIIYRSITAFSMHKRFLVHSQTNISTLLTMNRMTRSPGLINLVAFLLAALLDLLGTAAALIRLGPLSTGSMDCMPQSKLCACIDVDVYIVLWKLAQNRLQKQSRCTGTSPPCPPENFSLRRFRR